MASPATPPLSQATSLVARGLSALAKLANATGTLMVLALVATICADVVMRNLFHAPFAGTFELVQFLMVMIVFLQLPDVVRTNRLTCSDGFLAMLAARNSTLARLLARVIDAAAMVFMALIAWAIWPEFLRSWASGAFMGTPGMFVAPYWPIHLVILLSSLLASLLFLTQVIGGRQHPDRPLHEEQAA